ncbi:MAG TPA: transcriptional regulator [Eggerthellaceae bacterium]|nr:transcriptional regulator [Eggerthellaceae bacterium]
MPIADTCPCASPCPGDAVFRYVGGKWKLRILCSIHYGEVLRYSEIKHLVAGVSPTMLASSLRELEESGLIERRVYGTTPVKVEYRLTAAGRDLVPILCQLRDWAVAYEPDLYKAVN